MRLTRAIRQSEDSAQAFVTAVGKRMPFVLQPARDAVIAVRGRRYRRLAETLPLDPRAVVFQSYGAREYSCSPRALYEQMLAESRFDDHELIWAFKPDIVIALQRLGGYEIRGGDELHDDGSTRIDLLATFGTEALEQLKRATIVAYRSAEYYRSLARAGHWIVNCILPDHVKPREGQCLVQTWHGTPLKVIGCDITTDVHATYSVEAIHNRYRREGSRSTYMIAPSRFAAEKFASAFDLDRTGRADVILETGYPRNDVLSRPHSARAARVKERLGIPAGKRVVLYAPTWRDDRHATAEGGFVHEITADLDRLRERLGENHLILFRSHYLVAQSFDFSRHRGFVRDVSGVNDINDLYLASDVLVTDYSSVFFDFANLRRPIIFYMYDLERFSEVVRGLYLDPGELPGPIARTEEELLEAILASGSDHTPLDDHYRMFNDRFNYLDDGAASQRVLERIMPPVSLEASDPSRPQATENVTASGESNRP